VRVQGRPKIPFTAEDIPVLLDQVRTGGVVVLAAPLPAGFPDPDDAPCLEVALAGRAECVITETIRHFPPSKRQGMPVFTPEAFRNYYRQRMRRETRRKTP
jgi:predicted nucleic acid-binding protein